MSKWKDPFEWVKLAVGTFLVAFFVGGAVVVVASAVKFVIGLFS